MSKLAVLASGTGSILEAMLAQKLPVALVVADRPCRAIDVVAAGVVPSELVKRESFGKDFDRHAYTLRILEVLEKNDIGIVALCGFMTVFDPVFFTRFKGTITNTHPSLLPAFKGDKAVENALAYGVKVTGCTIHIVTPELDAGPILAQEAVVVELGDTVETLHERIKEKERVLYPRVLHELLRNGRAA